MILNMGDALVIIPVVPASKLLKLCSVSLRDILL